MQGTRYTSVLLKSFSASFFSVNANPFKKQSDGTSDTDNPNKCKTQKCNVDENMRKRLRELAFYTCDKNYAIGQRRNVNLHLCDCNSCVNKNRDFSDSKLSTQTKEFIEDILEKYEEALRDYRSYVKASDRSEEKNSSDESSSCSGHHNICTSSTTQHIPAKVILSSDNDRGSVNNEDREASIKVDNNIKKVQEDLERGLEKLKKQDDLIFWMGAVAGSLVGASIMLITFNLCK